MRILFLTSELCDFVKTGGLADVAKALPLELQKRGHDIRIMLPCYSKINNWFNLPVIAELTMTNSQNNTPINFKVRESHLGSIIVWLIDSEYYFNRNNLYAENNEAYQDNGERFAFFSEACVETVKHLNFQPEIVHCNDWHTALTPMILALKYTNDPFFKTTRSVLTIHNGAFQGIFDRSQLWMLPEIARVNNDSVTHGYANLNYLKCGVYYSDKINAVSPSYAYELTTFLGGHGMAQNFIARANDLCGIVNGCDYTDWDPSVDKTIPFHFSATSVHNKNLCKYLLQESTNLPVCDVPVFGMVCRLTDQKGINLLIPILNDFLRHKIQLILVGTGDPVLEKSLKNYTEKFSDRFVFKSVYDNNLAHLVEAGSDFFLMPSIFEPCGLNQMYSLAYGTLPIVRAVGGLKDTVVCYDEDQENATGFIFQEPDPSALLSCLRRVLIFYLQEQDEFMRIRTNAMRVRYNWQDSATDYEMVYQSALNKPRY
jgi:starch synthase